ncbi:hypothetical protein ACFYV5_29900 [Streptomyces sp. NPDC003035]|uniref:hypothetical protein n=1 Tax=Streptomyces sp. NPDC003035 TaxID=3364676 RepID=UPI0036A8FC0F
MISEPELVGEADFPAGQLLAHEPKAPRPPRPRRPWLWALGGAVVASTVWAGGLFAYERSQDRGVDLGGYGSFDNLCQKAKLESLTRALGERSLDSPGRTERNDALDISYCYLNLGPEDAGYSVSVGYQLHKVTDPEPEFAVRVREHGSDELTSLPGIGEQALFNRDEDNTSASLHVLDGQAEISIRLDVSEGFDEDGNPLQGRKRRDLSTIDAQLTDDMNALIAALKK